MKREKTVRVVTFSFLPDETMASQRLKRIVNGFLQIGWNVEVYATAPRHFRPTGLASEFDKEPAVTVYRHNSFLIEAGLILRAFLERFRNTKAYPTISGIDTDQVQNIRTPRLFPDIYILSRPRIFLHDLLKRFFGRRADLILASGPVFSSFLIAEHLARKNGAPLILDYRDPWTESDYINSRQSVSESFLSREATTEVNILFRSDLVTTVSNGLCKMLAKKTGTEIKVAYNSLPRAEREANLLPVSELPYWMQIEDRFRVTYTGSLYGGRRDITPLVRAFEQLEPSMICKIDLIVLGPDSLLVQKIVEDAVLTGLNLIVDAVPHDQVRAIQKYSDLLVLINWDKAESVDDYILTGKLFEYEAAQNPILGLGVSPESEMAEFINNGPHSLISNDPAAIAEFLRNIIAHPVSLSASDTSLLDISNAEHIAGWCKTITDRLAR